MTVRGLLLISHRGQAYFIEGGIKADKLSNLQTDFQRAVEANITMEGRVIPPDQLRTQAEAWRTAWNNALQTPFANLPENAGPIIFQAFNVEADIPEFGDAVVTGSSTNIDVVS